MSKSRIEELLSQVVDEVKQYEGDPDTGMRVSASFSLIEEAVIEAREIARAWSRRIEEAEEAAETSRAEVRDLRRRLGELRDSGARSMFDPPRAADLFSLRRTEAELARLRSRCLHRDVVWGVGCGL